MIFVMLVSGFKKKQTAEITLQHFGAYFLSIQELKKKLHGLSPRANYTDQATAACRQSDCQLLQTEGATWAA
jgi:hypothetical protein